MSCNHSAPYERLARRFQARVERCTPRRRSAAAQTGFRDVELGSGAVMFGDDPGGERGRTGAPASTLHQKEAARKVPDRLVDFTCCPTLSGLKPHLAGAAGAPAREGMDAARTRRTDGFDELDYDRISEHVQFSCYRGCPSIPQSTLRTNFTRVSPPWRFPPRSVVRPAVLLNHLIRAG